MRRQVSVVLAPTSMELQVGSDRSELPPLERDGSKYAASSKRHVNLAKSYRLAVLFLTKLLTRKISIDHRLS